VSSRAARIVMEKVRTFMRVAPVSASA
jgi:hypothetical protein